MQYLANFDSFTNIFGGENSMWCKSSSRISIMLGNLKSQLKKNWKLWKWSWWTFFQDVNHVPLRNWVQSLQKKSFFHIVEKSNIFWLKNISFCWKTKEKLEMKLLCWMINSIMLDLLQAFFIHKLLDSKNYSILKSADQFCTLKNFFQKCFWTL